MSALKRPEILALLAIVAGGLVYALFFRGPVTPSFEPADDPGEGKRAFTITSVSLHRDYGNARLDLEVRATNSRAEAVKLVPPDARLLAGSEAVPAFFLASAPPPELPAGATETVTLRYWLEKSHLGGPLTLEVLGESAPVKSAEPYDLESIPNSESRAFASLDWKS